MRKRIFILSITLLLLSTTFFCGSYQVFAADAEQQPPQEQNVVDPNLEKILMGMQPTDNISVIIYLRWDPSLDQQIQDIWEGQPDDEMHILSENLMQKLRNVSAEMRPYQEQLQSGDPTAIEKYKEIQEKYGITDNSTEAIVQRLNELHDAKSRQIDTLHERAYSEMQKQVRQKIEQLPDTKITSSTFLFNSFTIATKVSDIQALAAIPEVVFIANNAKGMPAISLNYDQFTPKLISPINGSADCPINELTFSWEQFKETTQYKFMISTGPSFTSEVSEAIVTNTNYEYYGNLKHSATYFWRVMALEPVPSDWSATFTFQTQLAALPSEATANTTHWMALSLVGLIIIITIAIGCVIWFLVTKIHMNK